MGSWRGQKQAEHDISFLAFFRTDRRRRRRRVWKSSVNLHNLFLAKRKGCFYVSAAVFLLGFCTIERAMIRMFFEFMLIHGAGLKRFLLLANCRRFILEHHLVCKVCKLTLPIGLCALPGRERNPQTEFYSIYNSKDLNECMTRKLMRSIEVETVGDWFTMGWAYVH